MQKAHLYEAVFLVNQGVDQVVRGLVRLKKAAGIGEEIYGDTLATLECTRAQVNLQFLTDIEQAEKRDAARYDRQSNRVEIAARGERLIFSKGDSKMALLMKHKRNVRGSRTLARGVEFDLRQQKCEEIAVALCAARCSIQS